MARKSVSMSKIVMMLILVTSLLTPNFYTAHASEETTGLTRLDAVVGFLSKDTNPEYGILPFYAPQNSSFIFDAETSSVGFDFGSTVRVRRIEIVDSKSSNDLNEGNYSVYVATQNLSKTDGVGSHGATYARPNWSKVPKSDWRFKKEIVNGKMTHVFEFIADGVVGSLVKVNQNKKSDVPAFTIENIGRDVSAYTNLPDAKNGSLTDRLAYVPTINGYIENDADPRTGQLGNWAKSNRFQLNSSNNSLVIDLGEKKGIKWVELISAGVTSNIDETNIAVFASNNGSEFMPVTTFSVEKEDHASGLLNKIIFTKNDADTEVVKARYIKIHTKSNSADSSTVIENLGADIKVSIYQFANLEEEPGAEEPAEIRISGVQVSANTTYPIENPDVPGEKLTPEAYITYLNSTSSGSFYSVYTHFNQDYNMSIDYPGSSAGIAFAAQETFDKMTITHIGETDTRYNNEDQYYIMASTDGIHFTRVTDFELTEEKIDNVPVHTLVFGEPVIASHLIVYTAFTIGVDTAYTNAMNVSKDPFKFYKSRRDSELIMISGVQASANSKYPIENPDVPGEKLTPEAYITYLNSTSSGSFYSVYTHFNQDYNMSIDYPGSSAGIAFAAQETFNKMTITHIGETDTRYNNEDQYYIMASTDGIHFTRVTDFELTEEKIDNIPVHTLAFDGPVTASHLIVYTEFTIGVDTAYTNAMNVSKSPFKFYKSRQSGNSSETYFTNIHEVIPMYQDIQPELNPYPLKGLLLSKAGRSVGVENKTNQPIGRIELWTNPTQAPSEFRLYKSDDNMNYEPVDHVSYRKMSDNSKTVFIADFPAITSKYVKIAYTGSGGDSVFLDTLSFDLRAFTKHVNSKSQNVIPATVGYLYKDANPEKGAAGNFGSTESVALDKDLASIVADLSTKQRFRTIKLFDSDLSSRVRKMDLSVYSSDDNVTYTQIKDFDFFINGNEYILYNMNGNGRYIKVHSHFDEPNYFVNEDNFSTFAGANIQTMIQVLDENPAAVEDFTYSKEIDVQNESGQLQKNNLLYLTYDQLGLSGLMSRGKVKPDRSDIRFIDANGNLLSCYDDGKGYYVRVPLVPVSGTKIKLIYGNAGATKFDDGNGTFQVEYGNRTMDYTNMLEWETKFATLKDGRMIMVNTSEVTGGRDVHLRYSDDNGKTWSERKRVSNSGKGDMGGVLVLADGTVLVSYFEQLRYNATNILDHNLTAIDAYVVKSSDNGQTWSEPVFIDTGWNYNINTTNMIELQNGNILMTVHHFTDNNGSIGITVVRSTDGGMTWTPTAAPLLNSEYSGFEYGYSEAAIIQLADGSIKLYCRQQISNDVVRLGEATSTDNGVTWTAVADSAIYATNTQPAFSRDNRGNVLLHWAGHNTTGSQTYQRTPLALAYSDDETATWNGFREIAGRTVFSQAFGYPNMMQSDFGISQDGNTAIFTSVIRGARFSQAHDNGDWGWYSVRIDDFDRYLYESFGAYNDFERAEAINGNYWWEIGNRASVSYNESTSGNSALRLQDNHTNDIVLAQRHFPGVRKGSLLFDMFISSNKSGLAFSLREPFIQNYETAGSLIEFKTAADGNLLYKNADGIFVKLPNDTYLASKKWYNIRIDFDSDAEAGEVFVDGISTGRIGMTAKQNAAAYFDMHSTSVADTGTDVYLDNLIVIDSQRTKISAAAIGNEQTGSIPQTFPSTGVITNKSAAVTLNGDTVIEVSEAQIRSGNIAIETSLDQAQLDLKLPYAVLEEILQVNKEATVTFATVHGAYVLPIGSVVQYLAANLSAAGREGATVTVTIAKADAELAAKLEQAAASAQAEMLGYPVRFEVGIVDGNGNAVVVNAFDRYISRILYMPGSIDSRSAVGVVWDESAEQFAPVPGVFRQDGDRTEATLKRRGNSVYAVLRTNKSFADLANHWSRPQVEALAAKLVVNGKSADRFDPNGKVTRAEFTALLTRGLGLEARTGSVMFTDVAGQWFAGAVGAAADAGLVQGFADGTFKPEALITRQEMAVLIARALAFAATGELAPLEQGPAKQLSDIAQVGKWARASVEETVRLGIVQGNNKGQFVPASYATRAEAAVMLTRLLQVLAFMNKDS